MKRNKRKTNATMILLLASAGLWVGCNPIIESGDEILNRVQKKVLNKYIQRKNVYRFDVDGDGKKEEVKVDPTRTPAQSTSKDKNDDGIPDEVHVGTKGGGTVDRFEDIDGDNEPELIVLDPSIRPRTSSGRDMDGDGDLDLIVVGTKGSARLLTNTVDMDDDGEQEMVMHDPKLTTEQSYGRDLDQDGDPDIMVIGTHGNVKIQQPVDLDGDGEKEMIMLNPKQSSAIQVGWDMDRDQDLDLISIGSRGGAKVLQSTDIDNDGEKELILLDPSIGKGKMRKYDIDHDGDIDIRVYGSMPKDIEVKEQDSCIK